MNFINKIVSLLAVISLSFAYAQDLKRWKEIKPEQRRELINNMSAEERLELLKQFRGNMLIDELSVPKEKHSEFKNLYNQYQESQKRIKEKFNSGSNYDKMNDDEAKQELEHSFEIGQQLLDNRKKYAEEFQKMMKPQQVLEMFQTEGKMRSKMMDRKIENEQRTKMKNKTRESLDEGRDLLKPTIISPQSRDSNTIKNNGVRTQSRRP